MQGWCHMTVARTERRPYQQKVRARQQAETRQRIIESAVALHLERGPAQTSINAIAERAGVNRVTVYRHFPDARTLLEACSAHAPGAPPAAARRARARRRLPDLADPVQPRGARRPHRRRADGPPRRRG